MSTILGGLAVGLLAGGVQLLTFIALNIRAGEKWNEGL